MKKYTITNNKGIGAIETTSTKGLIETLKEMRGAKTIDRDFEYLLEEGTTKEAMKILEELGTEDMRITQIHLNTKISTIWVRKGNELIIIDINHTKEEKNEEIEEIETAGLEYDEEKKEYSKVIEGEELKEYFSMDAKALEDIEKGEFNLAEIFINIDEQRAYYMLYNDKIDGNANIIEDSFEGVLEWIQEK